ncbi:MAG: hypothetical protein ACOYXT_07300 [Bacteroidota bacterium]
MELDELKDIWKKNQAEFTRKGETEIASMLKGSSRSIISKLKKSVWFELIFTIVAGLALLVYALTLPTGSLKWTSVSILILFVVYSFYYVKKLLLLIRFGRADDNIKVSLEKLIANLSSYLKFYKRSYTILYPVYFCLGLLFVGIEQGAEEFFNSLTKPKVIIYLAGVAGLFYACSTWLTKWYLKKLYGNHLEKLSRLLLDLNDHGKHD